MKDFKSFLKESTREFKYRMKTVADMTENDIVALERVLSKYHVIEAELRRTILQNTPLDFTNVENREVYILDFTTSVPLSQYALGEEIRSCLNVSADWIVVRNLNEPIEIETQRILTQRDIETAALKKDPTIKRASKLGTTSYYPSEEQGTLEEPIFGNEYNSNFLNQLAKVASERRSMEFEPKAPLFSWLNMPKPGYEETTFNDGMEGVKPVPRNKIVDVPVLKDPRYNQTSLDAFENDRQEAEAFDGNKGHMVVIKRINGDQK